MATLARDGVLQRPRVSAVPMRPAVSPLRGFDIGWFVGLNVAVVTALWMTHGGSLRLIDFPSWMIGVGELAALYGSLALLVDLVLISRSPWLERRYGMDRLNLWHRWAGYGALTLLLLHAAATTVGYSGAAQVGLWTQTVEFIMSWPDVLASVVGLTVLVVVAASSVRAARKSLSYETWWFIHLYVYLAIALSFAHQFAVGTDFIADPWARVYWVILYGLAAASILGYRWIVPAVISLRHRLRVVGVEQEAPGVVTIILGGRRLDRLAAEAGQFFLLRFLRRDRWWKAMPLSLSAPPDGRTLRFTVKAVGDDTRAVQTVDVGTRVAIEGPYGILGRAATASRRVLLVAGGIGVTPLRALFEDLDRAPGDVTLLYRTRRKEDAVFLKDLTTISKDRGFGFFVSYSRPNGRSTSGNPFSARRLLSMAPDVVDRDVYVCGPASLIAAATSSLRRLGVPSDQIHVEKFAY